MNLYKNDGVGPLCIACVNGHEGTAQLLLNNSADVNLRYKDGTSPLYIGCCNGHENIAHWLLSNVNLCNKNGNNPLWIDSQKGHEGIEQLLIRNAAEVINYLLKSTLSYVQSKSIPIKEGIVFLTFLLNGYHSSIKSLVNILDNVVLHLTYISCLHVLCEIYMLVCF